MKKSALDAGYEITEINRVDFEQGELALPDSIDAVVFCTGTCPIRPVALTPDELLAETVRVNCTLFLRLMRQIVAEKRYAGTGMKAVAVSSVSAVEGWPGGAAYCASKGALSAMCRAMDAELSPKGIAVTALEPRYIKTKMFDMGAGRMGVDPALAEDPAEFADSVIRLLNA